MAVIMLVLFLTAICKEHCENLFKYYNIENCYYFSFSPFSSLQVFYLHQRVWINLNLFSKFPERPSTTYVLLSKKI